MNRLSKLWHRLWGRSDRDIHFIESVINIESLVHDLGVWHLLTLKSPSTSFTFKPAIENCTATGVKEAESSPRTTPGTSHECCSRLRSVHCLDVLGFGYWSAG